MAATPCGWAPRASRSRAGGTGAASGLGSRRAGPRAPRSVPPEQAHQPALHLDPVGPEDAGLVGLVGGLESDRGAAPAQALQRDLLVVDERHHDAAVLGGLAALHDDGVAVEDAGVDHAVAGDL